MPIRFDFNFEATKAALLYLGTKDLPGYDKYKACKLLFLADREHLLRFGRTITGDDYFALPFGPTPSLTLDLLNDHEKVLMEGADTEDQRTIELIHGLGLEGLPYPRYQNLEQPNLDALSESDIVVLDQVATEHGHKNFEQLKSLTHGAVAYRSVWRDGLTQRRFRMRFEDFFADAPGREEFLQEILENQFLKQAFGS